MASAFPNRGQRERLAALHADGIGLFDLGSLDRLLLGEAVDRQKATSFGPPEHRRGCHPFGGALMGLRLEEASLSSRDEAPGQPVKRALVGLGMLADDPTVLTRLLTRRALVSP